MDIQQATDYVIFLSLFCGLETTFIIQSLAQKNLDSHTITKILANARAAIANRHEHTQP